MSRLVVIAQARIDSNRLPGKVLKMAGGMPVLAQVIRRAREIPQVAEVCLATSDRAIDDPVAEAAKKAGARVFRGSAQDVLSRYLGAAEVLNADVIMRLTCDCPLLDPTICASVVSLFSQSDADYVSNIEHPLWPHGLDCEVFSRSALELAGTRAETDADREHVTLWLRRAAGVSRVHLPGPGGALAMQRWTVDYPEDFLLVRGVLDNFSSDRAIPDWRTIADFLYQNPEIATQNAHLKDAARSGRQG